jgi:hypothetical protein
MQLSETLMRKIALAGKALRHLAGLRLSSMVHVGRMLMEKIREQASATMFSCPLMYRMSVVNCPMKLTWRICRGEALSDRCLNMKVSGLWPV